MNTQHEGMQPIIFHKSGKCHNTSLLDHQLMKYGIMQ